MNDLADIVLRLALHGLVVALVASVVCAHRLSGREAAGPAHDPRTCPECSRVRHPSRTAVRTGLARVPRQTRRGER